MKEILADEVDPKDKETYYEPHQTKPSSLPLKPLSMKRIKSSVLS